MKDEGWARESISDIYGHILQRLLSVSAHIRKKVDCVCLPSLATTSASITTHPRSSFNILATVLFPEAIPPVSPTRNIATRTYRMFFFSLSNSTFTLWWTSKTPEKWLTWFRNLSLLLWVLIKKLSKQYFYFIFKNSLNPNKMIIM